ncbi:MAG: hypothetical protein AAGI66_07620 [Cyanobacteria bacterium P01_H01_bin.74]
MKTKQTFIKPGLTAAMVFFAFSAFQLAHAYNPDANLLQVKGYSPEVVEITNQQRSKQEWKAPAIRRRSPKETLLHNIYKGNWTEGYDGFGAYVIRDN